MVSIWQSRNSDINYLANVVLSIGIFVAGFVGYPQAVSAEEQAPKILSAAICDDGSVLGVGRLANGRYLIFSDTGDGSSTNILVDDLEIRPNIIPGSTPEMLMWAESNAADKRTPKEAILFRHYLKKVSKQPKLIPCFGFTHKGGLSHAVLISPAKNVCWAYGESSKIFRYSLTDFSIISEDKFPDSRLLVTFHVLPLNEGGFLLGISREPTFLEGLLGGAPRKGALLIREKEGKLDFQGPFLLSAPILSLGVGLEPSIATAVCCKSGDRPFLEAMGFQEGSSAPTATVNPVPFSAACPIIGVWRDFAVCLRNQNSLEIWSISQSKPLQTLDLSEKVQAPLSCTISRLDGRLIVWGAAGTNFGLFSASETGYQLVRYAEATLEME